jgi:hypothetical protein
MFDSGTSTDLRQSQLLIERLGLRFPSQKVRQGLHLVLTAAFLQNHVAVPTAFLRIHGIRLEDGVEHVCGIDLGAVS